MRHPTKRSTRRRGARSRRGAALTVTLLSSFVVVGVGFAMLTVSAATQREYQTMVMRAQRRYLAQTGVAESLADMSAGGTGVLGTQASPVSRDAGTFRVSVTPNADGTMTLDSIGRVGDVALAICDFGAAFFDAGDCVGNLGGLTDAIDRHIETAIGQRCGNAQPDAAAAAGHERYAFFLLGHDAHLCFFQVSVGGPKNV